MIYSLHADGPFEVLRVTESDWPEAQLQQLHQRRKKHLDDEEQGSSPAQNSKATPDRCGHQIETSWIVDPSSHIGSYTHLVFVLGGWICHVWWIFLPGEPELTDTVGMYGNVVFLFVWVWLGSAAAHRHRQPAIRSRHLRCTAGLHSGRSLHTNKVRETP